ncbi:coiled-coil domain-containing protein [Paenibacillus chitinolyticus]|uniref:coiled-coil domain-containing protein n=1 Tax=Paenibacillus chitinolyticus TaxID=79263 RepID=UPI0035E1401F
MILKKFHLTFCALLIGTSLLFVPVHAENRTEAEKKETETLLQKGLTVHEIDREIARLAEEDVKLGGQLTDTEKKIAAQEIVVKDAKKRAGKVIRSYYAGERESLWSVLLSVRSLPDLLKTYEYLDIILDHDHRSLTAHQDAYRELGAMKTKLANQRTDLQKTKENYLKQKERILALQSELNRELDASGRSELILALIQELNGRWEQDGLPLFRTYFRSLAGVMDYFPELLTPGGKDSHLTLESGGGKFQMTDHQLNAFLRSKDGKFDDLTFQFKPDGVMAFGTKGDMDVSIKGTYEMEKDGDQPVIAFRVQELVFNGFKLPDTTGKSLEKEFNLRIYPKKLFSFVSVEHITLEDGLLAIKLGLNW